MRFHLGRLKTLLPGLPPTARVVAAFEELGLEVELDDGVLELDWPLNRPDCLSYFGLARECAAHFTLPMPPPPAPQEPAPAGAPKFSRRSGLAQCEVFLIEQAAVEHSTTRAVRRGLSELGLSSAGPLEDALRWGMLYWGLAATVFDADALQGSLELRRARAGETLATFDRRRLRLTPSDWVLADAAGPAGLPGLVAGARAGVSLKTRRVVMVTLGEQAAADLRRSAKRHAIATTAAALHAASCPPHAPAAVARMLGRRVFRLGKPPEHAPPKAVPYSPKRLCAILGMTLPAKSMARILSRVGVVDGDAFRPAPHRRDLSRPADLAAEVLRRVGYARIPTRRPKTAPAPAPAVRRLRRILDQYGFREVYSADFTTRVELQRLGAKCAAAAPRVAPAPSAEPLYLRPGPLAALLHAWKQRPAAGVYEIAPFFEMRRGRLYEEPRLTAVCLDGPRTRALAARLKARMRPVALGAVKSFALGRAPVAVELALRG